jgi:hypothetical protein
MGIFVKAGSARAMGRRVKIDAAVLALGTLLLFTTVLNFTVYAGQPLGVDEVWTGMIAGQRSVAGLIRQCEIEVNAPLTYVLAWLWAPVGGLSDAGLRLPSTLFACATPFVALAPSRMLPRGVRMMWAALLACWLPEFAFAQLARCYALVVLLATANTVAYARLLSRPGLGAAAVWAALSALLILDHYFALILIACQGFGYLAIRRGQAVRTWPAALIFMPALAELALKTAVLAHFAKPGVAWIDRLSLEDMPSLGMFLAGSSLFAAVTASALVLGWVLDMRRHRAASGSASREGASAPAAAAAAALAAALAVLISIGLGFFLPILTARYLAAEVPGLMLAVALLAQRFAPAWPLLPGLIVAGAVSAVVGLATHTAFINQPAVTAFSFEPAAKALMAESPRRLVFFWDNPVAQDGDPQQLSDVGDFFFKQAGRPIPIDAVTSTGAADPNGVLLAKAAAPGTDILWMFDREVEGTAAADHPPNITQRDSRWSCHDFGAGDIGILACHRRGLVQ